MGAYHSAPRREGPRGSSSASSGAHGEVFPLGESLAYFLIGTGLWSGRRAPNFRTAEVERLEAKSIPEIGFDLGTQAYRIVRHVLLEALL